MDRLINTLAKLTIFKSDFDYHLIRASMVFIAFSLVIRWFQYEADALIPYISHGPLIFWMYPVFGIRGATYFLGAAESLFGVLLFLGFWNKELGILGALGFCFSMISTFTIILSFLKTRGSRMSACLRTDPLLVGHGQMAWDRP
jgi:uncharacterized membrane protein YkgB